MKNRLHKLAKGIIAALAILNLILLFGFKYELFGFKWENVYYQENPLQDVSTDGKSEQNSTTAETYSPDNRDDASESGISNESSTIVSEASNSVSTSTAPEDNYRKCRTISEKKAIIRSGPGTEYDRITSVPKNTILTVIEEVNGWMHIFTDDGIEGYIRSDLIEMVDE